MRVVRTGWRFALPLLLLSPPFTMFSPPLGLGMFVIGIAVLLFFRDPARYPPPGGIVSPADGRISVIREEDDRLRIGVFMNVTDVHVNRAPLPGRITDLTHRPGAHRPAFSKDSDRNERVDFRIDGTELTIDVSLIAGAFARRISPYVSVDDSVERGERIGHIAFGSRADVLLPPVIEREALAINRGDRVRAGETPLVDPKIHGHNRSASDR